LDQKDSRALSGGMGHAGTNDNLITGGRMPQLGYLFQAKKSKQ
jgi:hypothetical protein